MVSDGKLTGKLVRENSNCRRQSAYYEYFDSVDYDDFDQENKDVRPGSRVMHETFGLGKVTDIFGSGEMVKAKVQFEGNNVKQLMLKFAKLKILN